MSFTKLIGLQVDFDELKVKIQQQINVSKSLNLFNTNKPGMIVKAFDLETRFNKDSFKNEVNALKEFSPKGETIALYGYLEKQIGKYTYGLLLIENCEYGDQVSFINKKPFITDDDILTIVYDVARCLNVMHENVPPVVHMDIKIENIFITKEGNYKIYDFSSCKIGPFPKKLTADAIRDSQIRTSQQYRSPELEDTNMNNPISPKQDIFSLGVLIYMICYKDAPFRDKKEKSQGKLKMLPDNPKYSNLVKGIIEKSLKANAVDRPSCAEILNEIVSERQTIMRNLMGTQNFQSNNSNEYFNPKTVQSHIIEESKTNTSNFRKDDDRNTYSSKSQENFYTSSKTLLTSEASELMSTVELSQIYEGEKHDFSKKKITPRISSGFNRFFNKIVTDSEGWILSCVEETDKAIEPKYLNNLINKSWKKPHKVDKVSQLIEKIYDENKQYTIIVLKIELLISAYVTKGPLRVFEIPEQKSLNNRDHLSHILDKIIEQWIPIAKMNIKESEDQARCSLYSYTIILFAYILLHKIKLGRKYSHGLLGNFSLEPFFESGNMNKLLTSEIFQDMFEYINICVLYLEQLNYDNLGFEGIQVSLILEMVYEIYYAISTLTHLIYAFKVSSNSIDTAIIDKAKFMAKIKSLDSNYKNTLNQACVLINDIHQLECMKTYYGLIPKFTIESYEILESVPVISGDSMAEIQDKYPPLTLFQKIGVYEIPICYGKSVDNHSGNLKQVAAEKDSLKKRPAGVPLFKSKAPTIPEVNEDSMEISNDISGIPDINNFYSNDGDESIPKDSLYSNFQEDSQYIGQDDTKFSILPKNVESKSVTIVPMSKRGTQQTKDTRETIFLNLNLKKIDDQMANNYRDFANNYDLNPKRSLINPGMEEFLKPINPSNPNNLLDSINIIEPKDANNYHSQNVSSIKNNQPGKYPQESPDNNKKQGDYHSQHVSKANTDQTRKYPHLAQINDPNLTGNYNQEDDLLGLNGFIGYDSMNSDKLSSIPITKETYSDFKNTSKKIVEIEPVQINMSKSANKEDKCMTNTNKENFTNEQNDELSFFFGMEGSPMKNTEQAKLPKETTDFCQNCDLFEEGIAELNHEFLSRKFDEIMPPVKIPIKCEKNVQCNIIEEIEMAKKMNMYNSSVQTDEIIIPKNEIAIQTDEIPEEKKPEENILDVANKIAIAQDKRMSTADEFMTLDLTDPNKEFKGDDIRIVDGDSDFSLRAFMLTELSKGIDDWLLKFDDIIILNKIGGGSTCEVYKGEYRGLECAIKKISLQTSEKSKPFIKEFKRELATLLKLRPHPNLVSLIGVCQNKDNLYILMEYCKGGSVFDLLHKRKHVILNWEQKKKIALDIVKGMIFLHCCSDPVIHRDQKSLNLLIDNDIISNSTNFNIKVADFGLARTMDVVKDKLTSYMGTFHWMAPEIFENKPYSLKADVFSYAICVWEVLTRQTPYKNLNSPHAIMKFVVLEKGRPDKALIPAQCPKELVSLMNNCWDQDPEKRPSFMQILFYFKKHQKQETKEIPKKK